MKLRTNAEALHRDDHFYARSALKALAAAVLLAACHSGCGKASPAPTAPSAPSPAPPRAPEPAAPTPVAAPGTIPSLDIAKPYFSGTQDAAGLAANAFALEQWPLAKSEFERALAETPAADVQRRAQLTLLLGVCELRLKNYPAAQARFAAAQPAFPELHDYVAYHQAVAAYYAHDANARVLAQSVQADSIYGAEAELLLGDLLRAEGDAGKTAAHYRDYLQRRPTGMRRQEASFRVGEALERLRRTRKLTDAEARELIASYRSIVIREPLSTWAQQAQARLDDLRKTAPTLSQPPFTSAEALTQAMAFFDGMRNPEAEAAFAKVLVMPGLTPAEACQAHYHQAQSRFKARDRQGAKTMFDQAAAACTQAANTDLHIKSLYQAGRAYAFVGEHDTAVARYQAAQTIDASHSYADDAMLREAEEWADLNNDAKVREVLEKLPTAFPQGDMRAEAMWRLGFRAWRAGKLDEAEARWRKQIELVPIDDNYYAEGQAQYWLGRVALARGNKPAALAHWRDAIMTYPAAYYALLALNRVRETDAAYFAQLKTELERPDPAASLIAFPARAEWTSPGFARATAYLRLGLGDPAAKELRRLGLAAPIHKKRVTVPLEIETLWAMAYLYDRAGNYGTSHWPTRWHILDYRRHWPAGAWRQRWEIAYPKAYWPLLTEHAARNNLPWAMQIAIVREESAFDPLLESYANAVGLTQMIFPTAKRFAQGTGIEVTRENLRDPVKNVTIGSRFLGFLFAHWKHYTMLVPPSYNAGEYGVKRMLKARGTWAADEFVEGIIDDQARNYSKRVLGTFFTYNWLYEANIPTMPLAIPTEFVPTT